ncbi:MAG: hypothetical protein AAGJ94_06955 [Pseudomonadota bacterium]
MTAAVPDRGSRESLVERLFKAFSKQLTDIEERIAGQSGDGIVEDAKVLSGLAKTLETLVTVERRLVQPDEGEAEVDVDAMRTELMSRLAALKDPAKASEPGETRQDDEG